MGKRAWILAGVAAYGAAGVIGGQYLAGGLYFLTNKAMPEGITRDTWSTYWSWYRDDPVQGKRLKVSAVGAAAIVGIPPLAIASALASRGRSLHGDARFATPAEVAGSGLLANKGIIVGKFNGRYLVFDGQEFVLVAAPTRSGKGVSIVIPNLLSFQDSVVVLDIKLENFKTTSKFRAAHGQQVFLFAPFSTTGETHRWNVLDTISRDPVFRVGDTQGIAQVLWPSDVDDKSKFWNDQARNLFQAIVLYLLETPSLPCTMGEVLRQGSGKGKPVKEHLEGLIAERLNGADALSDECVDAFGRFLSAPDNTLGSILSTFNAPLLIFANPIVDAATSCSDFDIAKVRKTRMSVYVGIEPNRLQDAALLVNLFFSQLINLNTNELPAKNPDLKYQCLLLLDELTALGKISILNKANSFIAGYNIRLLPIIQSISQLESVYGEKDTRTLVTNHAVQVVFPPQEQKDANEYSEMLGYLTQKEVSTGNSTPKAWGQAGSTSENTSSQKRALLLPQELKELPFEAAIILKARTKPIMGQKAFFYSDSVFMDRLRAQSPTLAAIGRGGLLGLGKREPTKEELDHVIWDLGELSAEVPRIDFHLFKARAEGRTRQLREDEEIDLSKLAVDMNVVPAFDDQLNPSEASIEATVDAFFQQLSWIDQETGEITEYGSGTVSELSEHCEPMNGDQGDSAEACGEQSDVVTGGEGNLLAMPDFEGFSDLHDNGFARAKQSGAAGEENSLIDLSVLDD